MSEPTEGAEDAARPEPEAAVEGQQDETTREISVPDYVVRDFDVEPAEDEGPESPWGLFGKERRRFGAFYVQDCEPRGAGKIAVSQGSEVR